MSSFTHVSVPRDLLGEGLAGGKLLTLCRVLSLDQHEERGCYAGNARLSRELGVTSRTVQNHISDLVDSHYLHREDWVVYVSASDRMKVERRLCAGPRLRVKDLSPLPTNDLSRGPRKNVPPGYERLFPPRRDVVESAVESSAVSEETPDAGAHAHEGDSNSEQQANRREDQTPDGLRLCATEGCAMAARPSKSLCTDCLKQQREEDAA